MPIATFRAAGARHMHCGYWGGAGAGVAVANPAGSCAQRPIGDPNCRGPYCPRSQLPAVLGWPWPSWPNAYMATWTWGIFIHLCYT